MATRSLCEFLIHLARHGSCRKMMGKAHYSGSPVVYMPRDSPPMAGTRDTALIEAFAKVLRAERKGKGLTQEALAHEAGVARTFIGLLESAKRQPALSVICAIAKATDQKAGHLVDKSWCLAAEMRKKTL